MSAYSARGARRSWQRIVNRARHVFVSEGGPGSAARPAKKTGIWVARCTGIAKARELRNSCKGGVTLGFRRHGTGQRCRTSARTRAGHGASLATGRNRGRDVRPIRVYASLCRDPRVKHPRWKPGASGPCTQRPSRNNRRCDSLRGDSFRKRSRGSVCVFSLPASSFGVARLPAIPGIPLMLVQSHALMLVPSYHIHS